MLQGDPLWRPIDGTVRGALHFDGTDDYVTTEYVVGGARFGFVLSPSDGPFTVFAWVKGGVPGQVVLSQIAGVNWLMADTSTGALMTELKGAGRRSTSLLSEAVITDGNWHRIGFTWDGSSRLLYVDDVAVADDTQTGLAQCWGAMNIGCGKTAAAGTFWSGLIDDVRIYNQALEP
jgi:hypothetical protein